ncbi:hypothetical protein ACTD5D_33630 [Nocardia takedensis]|uniref:hypothetical protein n=1 Tax=Nocardia takedensis TaxID=259390 RepID=UPI003F75ED9D
MTPHTSTVPTEQPALTSAGDTAASRCAYYRHQCGLPTILDPDTGRIRLRATSAISAVILPIGLATDVRALLDRDAPRCGPIVALLNADCWMFLVTGRPPQNRDPTEQLRHRIRHLDPGSEIALPSPRDEQNQRRIWVTSPHLAPPSTIAVLDAARDRVGAAGGPK